MPGDVSRSGPVTDCVEAVEIWLVGAGPMAQAYAAVLSDMGRPCRVIGRGAASAATFERATGRPVVIGGLEAFLVRNGPAAGPISAIVATPVDALARSAAALIEAGISLLLVEKPAGLNPDEVAGLAALAERRGARAHVAYNRRFHASAHRARVLIAQDGGALSFRLELSEFASRIADSAHPEAVKRNWLYANVLDLAFFLGGFPARLEARAQGRLDWHPAGARFAGHGVTSGARSSPIWPTGTRRRAGQSRSTPPAGR